MKTQGILHKVIDGKSLSEEEMKSIMNEIMDGQVDHALLSAFLTALRMKGETVAEIFGAAQVMREKAEPLNINSKKAKEAIDTCGTGGDNANTFNISTTVAFVVAGAGIPVAKHGNYAVSSRSGSADVLKCLGVNIEANKKVVEQCIEKIGIGFLFAPALHKAMKHVAGVRKKLGFRTIFNLLGPLTNPARVRAQVVGVFDSKWTSPLAQVLKNLGVLRAFVVHGEDGLDEITLTCNTKISELSHQSIKDYDFNPMELGFKYCSKEDLEGGLADNNATILKELLHGASGPKRDIVLLNAGVAIVAAGKAKSFKEGITIAKKSIDSGRARQKLRDLCHLSHCHL